MLDKLAFVMGHVGRDFTTFDMQDIIYDNSPCQIPNLVYEARQCVNDRCCCNLCDCWNKEVKHCFHPGWDLRRRAVQ